MGPRYLTNGPPINGPPIDGPDQPWQKKWGDYLTGDVAQAFGSALGGYGAWQSGQQANELEEEKLQLARERYEREAAFQEQKHADEKAHRESRRGTGPTGPINWRQY